MTPARSRRAVLAGLAALPLAGRAMAQTPEPLSQSWPQPWTRRDSARIFFFGNSLIHHLTDSDATTVPHWMAALAQAGGQSLAAEGRWGFPRDFAAELPPVANWRIAAVPRAWDPWTQPFRAGRFDTVILTPENFIQYDPPDRPYQGVNPDGSSPLQATLRVLDWVQANADAPRLLIYEGWADLHPFSAGFPPDAAALRRYHAQGRDGHHRWFVDYTTRLRAERPGIEIALIPVGRILAMLAESDLLADLEVTALYADRSPHGTASTYLLAAMITYAAVFGAVPPALPADTLQAGGIDPRIAARYDRLAVAVQEALIQTAQRDRS